MGGQKRENLHVRISPELKAQLDEARGDVSAQRYVTRVLEREMERRRAKETRFLAHARYARQESGIMAPVDELAVFIDAASRDAWVAEFPEGRRALTGDPE